MYIHNVCTYSEKQSTGIDCFKLTRVMHFEKIVKDIFNRANTQSYTKVENAD